MSSLSNPSQAAQDKKLENIQLNPWIHAWSNPVAGIKTITPWMCLADLNDNGDHLLIMADENKSIKIYQGMAIYDEFKITNSPTAVQVIYTSDQKPALPLIVIASMNSLYMFQHGKPHFLFQLPDIPINSREQSIWKQLQNSQADLKTTVEEFQKLRESKIDLSPMCSAFLANPEQEYKASIKEILSKGELRMRDFISCLSKIRTIPDEEKSISKLVIGTERRNILIMDENAQNIENQIEIDSEPVSLLVDNNEGRILILCRDGNIHEIRKMTYKGITYEIEEKGICFIKYEKIVAVGTMFKCIHGYISKSKKMYSIFTQANILDMIHLKLPNMPVSKVFLVSLDNFEIRLYNEKMLIHIIKADYVTTGLIFGPYGREEGSLIINYKNGGLMIKMLQRQAKLNTSSYKQGIPIEQDIPLNVPKKTKLFIELTQRERDDSIQMHRQFQTDLCSFRLRIYKTYFQTISQGNAPLSTQSSAKVRLNAMVQGLGPIFNVKLALTNIGKIPLHNLFVHVRFNEKIYKLNNQDPEITFLIPGKEFLYNIEMESIDLSGIADAIKVFVCNSHNDSPLVNALINLPMTDLYLMN